MNAKVESIVSKATKWQAETNALREIIFGVGELTEELKWGKPTYTFQESNILIIQGFKEYCALMFCKGSLLPDEKGLLVAPTENMQGGRQMRFKSVGEITKLRPALLAYIEAAIAAERAGLKVKYRETSEFPVPEELQAKLDTDAKFKAAFEALTPGRQRGYLLHFAAPKQAKTREARIEKCRELIFNGKGWNEELPSGVTAAKGKSKRSN